MKVIAIMGGKNSGKTRTATFLIKSLSAAGFRVASIKHIHHSFTMDTQGKDTWKMHESGARIVSSISPNEVAILRKPNSTESEIERLLKLFEGEGIDVTVTEGFLDVLGKRKDVLKILTVSSPEDVPRYSEMVEPDITVFTGRGGVKGDLSLISLEDEGERLAGAVIKALGGVFREMGGGLG